MARFAVVMCLLRSVLVAGVVLLALAGAKAQVIDVTNDQATPKLGVGHDYIGALNEIVSPSNGSLSLRIHVATPSGRGLTLPFGIDYNSNGSIRLSPNGVQVAVLTGADSGFAEAGGWRYALPVLSDTEIELPGVGHPGDCMVDTGFVFTDPASSREALSLAIANLGSCNAVGVSPQTSYTASNDPFYTAWTQNGAQGVQNVPFYVADLSGTVYHFPYLAGWTGCIGGVCAVADYIEDRNGNKITIATQGSAGFPSP